MQAIDQTQFKENPLFDGDDDDEAVDGFGGQNDASTLQKKGSLSELVKGAGWVRGASSFECSVV
jgi:hypothetical protein